MSETKFTKGEWRVKRFVNEKGFEIAFNDDGELVTDYVYEESDAHLIAAAPEMYKDIEDDIKELSHELNNKNLTPHARAHLTNKLNVKTKLLAKARGEK